MALTPTIPRRNPLASLIDFAARRSEEAASVGDAISQLARPVLANYGVDTGQPMTAPVMPPVAPPAAAAPTQPVQPLPKTTSDAEEYYIRELTSRGLSRNAATGIVAGMISESGLNPTVNEARPLVPGSRGGYGLYQLTGPRRIAFERWASEQGRPLDDQAQLDYMMQEFAGPERPAYNALIEAPDAQSAAAIFTDRFLRPGISHTAQSAQNAARMTGEAPNLNLASASTSNMPGGAGGGYGAAPQNVEDIIAGLYPEQTEADQREARRRDVLLGLSRGFSAMSQGRPIELSDIAQRSEERRRQAVLDMREREKARAAAGLVYGQTGDAGLASAIATGAISYNDVLTERQMRRAEEIANDQRIKDAAAAGALADTARSMGLPDSIVKAAEAGADITTSLDLYDKKRLADKLASQEQQQAEVYAQNVLDAEEVLKTAATGTPEYRAAERVVALGGTESYFDIIKTRVPEKAPPVVLGQSEILVDPATGKQLAAGPAPDEKQFARQEDVALWEDSRKIAEQTSPEALARFLTSYPTPADLAKTRAVAIGGGATTISALNEALADQGLTVVEDPNNPGNPLVGEDGKYVTTMVAGGKADIAAQEEQRQQEAAAAEAEQLASKEEMRAQQEIVRNGQAMRLAKDVYDLSLDFTGGALAGKAREFIANQFSASAAGQAQGQLKGIEVSIFVDQLTKMRESSPTGAAVGNVTEGERAALAAAFGALQIGGDPAVLRQNLRAFANAQLDLIYGTPEQLRQAVKDGKIDAATAEKFGARYVIDDTEDAAMTGDLGAIQPLGLTDSVQDNILYSTPEQAEVVSELVVDPESPDPEFEAALIDDPALIANMDEEAYNMLSPERKAVFDKIIEKFAGAGEEEK